MFVLARGTVDDYRAEPGSADVILPLEPGAEPGVLLAEAGRRIRMLASPPVRHDGDRMLTAASAPRHQTRAADRFACNPGRPDSTDCTQSPVAAEIYPTFQANRRALVGGPR